ncbi:MAG TPA: PAS domain-containing protein, partial [Telluria sp.]|nr:PAS domain-containing protein [Telluria sp.]
MNAMRPSRFRSWGPALLVLGYLGGRYLSRSRPRRRAPRYARGHSGDIIHNASEAIISTDEASRIVLANPSAAAMFATTVRAMQGSPLGKFIFPQPAAGAAP